MLLTEQGQLEGTPSRGARAGVSAYEQPKLTPVGNLNDVLAASTQQLNSDSAVICNGAPGAGSVENPDC